MRRFIGIWTLVAVCNRAVHAQGLPSFSLLSPNFLSPQFTKNHNQFIKNGPSSKVYQNSAVVNSVNGCACPGSINGVPPVHVTLCICNNNNNQKHLPDVTVSKKVREEEEVSGESHTVIIPDGTSTARPVEEVGEYESPTLVQDQERQEA
ncbi:unnamed protein product [Bursaphelenchus okinawaensis]|uniref:Uncharacterized protein n=1 Tax=Bursaphelenchus okinawaensis TaxID=465554 RepID=A0A811KS58_9BILA|nr:unnamed protein product [Bursaphelenchus okinawaensis]CAG9110611.1 unnamed protein product [Bursaphelenchus okinawaensis]